VDAAPADDVEAILDARARAGRAIRDIGHAFIGRHATLAQIEQLADVLESIGADLWPADPRLREHHPFAKHQPDEYPQGRFEANYDDRPISGRSSPWGLDPVLHRRGDEIDARVTLRAAHEGAPNRSHGGIVAALFDDVFGYMLGVIRQPAFTGELSVRYLAPTPLHRELSCRVRLDSRTSRKLQLAGSLTDVASEEVVATAKATFIAVDPERFARLTAERPAPPDEDIGPDR
jgi:acyl-coenzyme A thioesterase PaaI-like protein